MVGFPKKAFSGKKHKVESAVPTSGANEDSQSTAIAESPQASKSHHLLTRLPVDLDLYFSAWVIGTNSTVEIAPGKVERQILIAVEDLMKSELGDSGLLPRVPAVIPRLMRSLRDESITTMNIVEEITQDPTVVGEVIRLANSAYYRTAVPTSTLEQAIVKLGHSGLRQVISTIAFRSIISVKTGHFLGAGSPLLWKQTEKSAHAARYLAMLEGVDIFDAYLAALVQNVGFTVVLKVLDKHLNISEPPCSIAFYQALGVLARRLTLHIVSSWNFPPDIVKAIEEQIDIESLDNDSQLGAVLYEADRLSKLFLLEKSKRIQIDLEQVIGNPDSIHESNCAECYEKLASLGDESD